MDKNLQRIVGVLIVLALAVVLSPLLFSKGDGSSPPIITTVAQSSTTQPVTDSLGNSTKTTTANALPPAAHSVVVTAEKTAQASPAAQSSVVAASQAATPSPQPKTVQSTANTSSSLVDKSTLAAPSDNDVVISSVIGPDPDDEVLPQEDDDAFTSLPSPQESFQQSTAVITPDHVATQDNLDRVKAQPSQPKKSQEKISTSLPVTNKIAKAKTAKAKTATTVAAVKTTKSAVTAHKKNLEKITKTAWVIQLGSFKNKMNAIHLTNKLRAIGYTAFTREINSKSGNLRIVYIGPETELASARVISKKLEQDLKLQGIIVNYKPLAL